LRVDLRGLPIGTTLVELGPVPTDLLAKADDYAPTRDSFRRMYRLHMLADMPRETVAAAIVEAVSKNRRYVRLPRRAALFATLVETPRRITALALTGVAHQPR
jgi:hypothetical protein